MADTSFYDAYKELGLDTDKFEDLMKKWQGQSSWDVLSPGQKWGAGGAIASGILSDLYAYQPYDDKALQKTISPLEESYKNLLKMSEDYADPSSQMNVQMRNTIRGQNLEGMTDIARRAANEAVGTVDDSATTKQMSQNAISTAISNALENYNRMHGDRMKQAADLKYKAGSIGNILSQARQSNLEAKMEQRRQLAGKMGDWSQQFYNLFTNK